MVSLDLIDQISVAMTQTDLSGRYLQVNQPFCRFTEYSNQELLNLRFQDLIHPEDLESFLDHQIRLSSGQLESLTLEQRLITKSSKVRWVNLMMSLIQPETGDPNMTLAIIQDITARKQDELRDRQWHRQRQLLYQITQQIRNSLDLDQILNSSVDQIRAVLQIDRVVFYRFEPDWSGYVIAESVGVGWPVMLGRRLYDPCLAEDTCIIPYTQGKIQRTADIHQVGFASCYVELLDQFQVKANLVVPILGEQRLWGLIVAQHCQSPREWSDGEVDLIQHLSLAISIAIQQAQLYRMTQQLNQDLGQQIEDHTRQLQRTLRFEALLRRIIEKVRESLSEDEILSVAVRELGEELQTLGCNTTLFDEQIRSGRVTHDHVRSGSPLLHRAFETSEYPELFQQILSGWGVQLCHLDLSLPRPLQTCLICPIADDQGVIGGLWLNRPVDQIFTMEEVDLVQQVALQCAIGLRQARLYWAAQQQVVELERLNLLKDDFLSTVSHELRTPLSNIRMALYMLNLAQSDQKRQQYYEMAVNECARQTQLIEDLLNLQQLEAGQYETQSGAVDLREVIETVADAMIPQIRARGQQLQLQVPDDLPEVITDRVALERTLRELLDNAHKHGSAEAQIQVRIEAIDRGVQVQISNAGDLPTEELPRLFDKFYRIPSPDRWRLRGTGLGLALVQRLVGILDGKLWVRQEQGWVHFLFWIPARSEQLVQ